MILLYCSWSPISPYVRKVFRARIFCVFEDIKLYVLKERLDLVICWSQSILQHKYYIMMPLFHRKIQRRFLRKVPQALLCAQLEQ
jgi:hypothetical protein